MNKKKLIINLRAEAWDQTDSKVARQADDLQFLLDKQVWSQIVTDVEAELWKAMGWRLVGRVKDQIVHSL